MPEGPELDRAEQPEEDVREEAGRAGQQLPRESESEASAAGRVRVDAGGGAVRGRRNARPVEEGASTAGDHVEGLADHAPLVVMKVAAQVEHAVRREGEVTGGEHGLSHGIGFPEGQRRVGSQEDQPIAGPLRPPLDEERALTEVEPAELAVHAPQIESRRERQRPVRRFLHGRVAPQREPGDAVNRSSAGDRAERLVRRPDEIDGSRQLVEVKLPDQGGPAPVPGRPLARRLRSLSLPVGEHPDHRIPAEEPGESVQPVIPVVVSRDAQEDAAMATRSDFLQDLVPRLDDPSQDLPSSGHGVRGVASEEEDVAARQDPGVATLGRSVLGEHEARHRAAHVAVVPGVGDEVDPEWPPEALDESGGVRDRGPQHARSVVQELVRAVWAHPVPGVHGLAGDGRGGRAAEVSEERRAAEPADRVRWAGAVTEAARRATVPPAGERDGGAARGRARCGIDDRRVAHGSLGPSRVSPTGTPATRSGARVVDRQADHHAPDDRDGRGRPPGPGDHRPDDLHPIVDHHDGVSAHLRAALAQGLLVLSGGRIARGLREYLPEPLVRPGRFGPEDLDPGRIGGREGRAAEIRLDARRHEAAPGQQERERQGAPAGRRRHARPAGHGWWRTIDRGIAGHDATP